MTDTSHTDPDYVYHIAQDLFTHMGLTRRFYYYENQDMFQAYCSGCDTTLPGVRAELEHLQYVWAWQTGLANLSDNIPQLADVAAYEANCEREELAYPTLAPAPIDERTDLPARLRAEQLDLCLGPSPRPIGW